MRIKSLPVTYRQFGTILRFLLWVKRDRNTLDFIFIWILFVKVTFLGSCRTKGEIWSRVKWVKFNKEWNNYPNYESICYTANWRFAIQINWTVCKIGIMCYFHVNKPGRMSQITPTNFEAKSLDVVTGAYFRGLEYVSYFILNV